LHGDQPCRKAATYTGQHKQNKRVGFEVLTTVVMKISIFWDTAPWSPYMKRRFGGTYHLHLQGLKSEEQEIGYSRWLGTSETSVHIRTTRRCTPEDGNFQNADRHARLEWDSNPRSQCLSGQIYFMS
jgi:hypothetical protein